MEKQIPLNFGYACQSEWLEVTPHPTCEGKMEESQAWKSNISMLQKEEDAESAKKQQELSQALEEETAAKAELRKKLEDAEAAAEKLKVSLPFVHSQACNLSLPLRLSPRR